MKKTQVFAIALAAIVTFLNAGPSNAWEKRTSLNKPSVGKKMVLKRHQMHPYHCQGGNNATSDQYGYRNGVTIGMKGCKNSAAVYQHGKYNSGEVAQAGARNRTNLTQFGIANRGKVDQKGFRNSSRMFQYGSKNKGEIVQQGYRGVNEEIVGFLPQPVLPSN